ncbi:sulfotransferase [Winogradskyella sp. MH6]|uniref:sulfotransferase n=1 Tax=Winogradskyella sp. MH6 TaxID=2929510 RepID=UPI001FB4DDE3|nr:sulfotransferase [Winogradskyella sp. MH6]
MKPLTEHWRVKKLKNNIAKSVINNKNYSPLNNHYLFADPRGGSTWLTEMVQKITNEPIIWEPLHLNRKSSPFKALNFDWRQYIPEDETWESAKNSFNLLFKGKVLNDGVLYHSTFKQCLTSSSLLFKICRGSGLIPWLTKNHDFNYKPIHLIRHPFAVVSSQLRHGGWSQHKFTQFNIPETPYNQYYIEHSEFLKSLKSIEQVMVAMWCISNLRTLNNKRNNCDWITINYEDLILNPYEIMNIILDQWHNDYDISQLDFFKNSKTTKDDSPKSKEKRITHWEKNLSEIQKKDMGTVLDYFNVTHYAKDNPYPIKPFITKISDK